MCIEESGRTSEGKDKYTRRREVRATMTDMEGWKKKVKKGVKEEG